MLTKDGQIDACRGDTISWHTLPRALFYRHGFALYGSDLPHSGAYTVASLILNCITFRKRPQWYSTEQTLDIIIGFTELRNYSRGNRIIAERFLKMRLIQVENKMN